MEFMVAILSKYGLEILGIAIIVGMIGLAFHKSSTQIATSWESDLVTNIDGYYQGGLTAKNFSGLSNSVAIKAALAPKGMMTGDGNTLKGPWSNSYVTLSPTGNGMGFIVNWTEVPNDDCATFAHSQGATTISINGTAIDPTNSNAATSIALACDAGSSSSTTTISFEHDG